MSYKAQTMLWLVQRTTAAVLAICVAVHLVVIIYAMRGGLSAAEILGRTRGNVAWLAFYSIFVLAASVHAPIGLRSVCMEWLRWRGRSLEVVLGLFAFLLLATGLRAAWSVFG